MDGTPSPFTIGEPGRLALEVSAGRPLGFDSGADVELSAHSIGGLELRAATVRGLMHRHRNTERQDAWSVAWNDATQTLMVAVADGVGSKPRSREASARAVSVATQTWTGEPSSTGTAVRAANEELRRMIDSDPTAAASMATTLVVMTVDGDHRVRASWVGDSAVWTLTAGTWRRLTSLAAEDVSFDGPVQALPSASCEPHEIEFEASTGSIFVMTDGVDKPLNLSSEVRAKLGSWWQYPPEIFEFGAQVSFARRSFMDDRTVVGVWTEDDRVQGAGTEEVPTEEREPRRPSSEGTITSIGSA